MTHIKTWDSNYGGILFNHFRIEKESEATVCDVERAVFTGKPQIYIARGQEKFGDQLVFQMLSKKGTMRIEPRNDTDSLTDEVFDKIEIYMSLEDGKALIQMLNAQFIIDGKV